jgi:hypothetical protein
MRWHGSEFSRDSSIAKCAESNGNQLARGAWRLQPSAVNPLTRKARFEMDRSLLSLFTSAVLLSSAIACGSADDVAGEDQTASRDNAAPGDTIASRADALTWRTRAHRLRTPLSPIDPTGAAGTSSSAPATPVDAAAAIDAARTADGAAIPQSSLPGGACPAVVAAVGFWSCVSVGDQCSFSSGGVTHHCSCNRVDGEGQYPAWVCD